MEGLANLDQVAYVRFASVYKNFKEAKDFEQFIGNLNVTNQNKNQKHIYFMKLALEQAKKI